MAARAPKKPAAKRKRPAKKPEDPRIVALGKTLLATIARELKWDDYSRKDFDDLAEYLDYMDHAVYSHDEIAGMFDELVEAGIAAKKRGVWSWVPLRSGKTARGR